MNFKLHSWKILKPKLDKTKPAFKFLSQERFDHVKYSDELLKGLKCCIEKYREQLVNVLTILLPRLVQRIETQRGGQYQFGESVDESAPNQLQNMNLANIDNAPVNNLDSERAVGFMQLWRVLILPSASQGPCSFFIVT